MDSQHCVEFLCLSCGLQGLRSAAESGEKCPRCGGKLVIINRESETAYSATV